jgi:hypothetical protein
MASIHIGCWVSNEKAAAEKEVAERRRRVKVVLKRQRLKMRLKIRSLKFGVPSVSEPLFTKSKIFSF